VSRVISLIAIFLLPQRFIPWASDHRFGHRRKTLELIRPYFSVQHFSLGKTETEKCWTEKYGPLISKILRHCRNADQSPNIISVLPALAEVLLPDPRPGFA
jgi:hypothetical protein